MVATHLEEQRLLVLVMLLGPRKKRISKYQETREMLAKGHAIPGSWNTRKNRNMKQFDGFTPTTQIWL